MPEAIIQNDSFGMPELLLSAVLPMEQASCRGQLLSECKTVALQTARILPTTVRKTIVEEALDTLASLA